MRKTLLLCFIHGFKGGDDTFGGFPEHLRALVSHALPKVTVAAITYPKFETRGDLKECVGKFREWYNASTLHPHSPTTTTGRPSPLTNVTDNHLVLYPRLQNQVIDLEVAAGTPSPTIDPSVRTILIGHSMGGIVAADTILSLVSEQPIAAPAETNAFMFPYVQGLLAFDTPYLGIAPSVVAHGAEGHYKTVSTALSTLGEVAGVFGWSAGAGGETSEVGARQNAGHRAAQQAAPTAIGALPVGPSSGPQAAKETMSAAPAAASIGKEASDAAAMPAWQRWGKYAMFAGAAGAMAAGGAAAYVKRETLSAGWSWVGSHLAFVGCLVRGEELRQRVVAISKLEAESGLGFANLYTNLGLAAKKETGTVTVGSGLLGSERTFCSLPKSELRRYFVKCVNDMAEDETVAHMSMFLPRENPGYFGMCERAKELVVGWASGDWYEASTRDGAGGEVVGVDELCGVEIDGLGDEKVLDEDTVMVD